LALSLWACKSDGAKPEDAGMQPQSGHTGSAAQSGMGTTAGQSGAGGIRSAPQAGDGAPPQAGNGSPAQAGNMATVPHARLKFQLQGVK
jgi:hypothetical protein